MMEAIEIESLQSQPSPRVLNTHVPTQMLPAQIKDKKVKLIHLYRNPKDVAVSLYHHRKQVPVLKDVTVEDMIRDYIIDEGIVGDWKNHLTVAQSEAVDAKMKELEGCGKFHFRYTL